MKPVSSIRKMLILPVALLTFALIISAQNAPPAETEIALTDAIANGSIQADVSSIGKYSGRSVKLAVTNTTNRSLKLLIPGGTAYVPGEDGEQTLIQLEPEYLVLEPKATKTHMIAAFCSEASDMSPSEGGKFKISKCSNKKLNEAIAYLKDKNVDKSTFQDAVWAITDNHSVSNVQASNPQTQEFRKYLATLTGQEDTWYTTPRQHTVNEQRRIVSQTMIVHGQVQFPSDGTSVIRQEVIDKDGTVRFEMPPSTPKKSTKVTMDFSVRVRGWEPGDYTLRILKDGVEIKSYPFVLS